MSNQKEQFMKMMFQRILQIIEKHLKHLDPSMVNDVVGMANLHDFVLDCIEIGFKLKTKIVEEKEEKIEFENEDEIPTEVAKLLVKNFKHIGAIRLHETLRKNNVSNIALDSVYLGYRIMQAASGKEE